MLSWRQQAHNVREGGLHLPKASVQVLTNVGVPASADAVAYDSMQRLLMISTSDGRLKLIGASCSEVTLASASNSATLALHIIPNTGCVLRLNDAGVLELWSVRAQGIISRLDANDAGGSDQIVVAVPLLNAPFVVVGCASGGVGVVRLASSPGELSAPARAVTGLEWMPFFKHADAFAVRAGTRVAQISVSTQMESIVRLLVMHEGHGVTSYNLATQQVIAFLAHDDALFYPDQADKISAICWASRAATSMLTGHEDGRILLWAVAEDGDLEPLRGFSVIPDEPRDAVHSLSISFGHTACLVVRGGHMRDLPQSLSIMRFKGAEVAGEPDITRVPWFGNMQGFELVRAPGSFAAQTDSLTGVITLTEGGHLCIVDVDTNAHEAFTLDVQARVVTHSCAVCVPLTQGRGALSLAALRVSPLARERRGDREKTVWGLALNQSKKVQWDEDPHAVVGEVMVLGHADGSVTTWDATRVAPGMMSVTRCGQRAVTLLALDAAAGLMATGHESGEVNIFQWCPHTRDLQPVTLGHSRGMSSNSSNVLEGGEAAQARVGWQCIARVPKASSNAQRHVPSALQWHIVGQGLESLVLLAIGFDDGTLCVVDLSPDSSRDVPKLIWQRSKLIPDGIGSLHFVSFPCEAPGKGEASAATTQLVLIVVTQQSCFCAVSVSSGQTLGKMVTPKKCESLVACVPVTEYGSTAETSAEGAVQLPWAGPEVCHHAFEAASPSAPSDAAAASPMSPTRSSFGFPRPDAEPRDESRSSSSAQQAAAMTSSALPSPSRSPLSEGDASPLSADWDSDEELAEAAKTMRAERQSKGAGLAAFKQVHGFVRNTATTATKGARHAGKRIAAKIDKATRDRSGSTEHAQRDGSSKERSGHSVGEGAERCTDAHAAICIDQLVPALPVRSRTVSGAVCEGRVSVDATSPTSASEERADASTCASGARICTYIAIVTAHTLRLYAAQNVLTGDRSTLKKVKVAHVQLSAAPLLRGPTCTGVIVWSQAAGIEVYRLPDLELLESEQLHNLTGWSWDWERDALAVSHLSRRAAICSTTGLVVLCGPCQELLLLGVDRPRPRLATPSQLFDYEVAAAASAAESASRSSIVDSRGATGQSAQTSGHSHFKPADPGGIPNPGAALHVFFKTIDRNIKNMQAGLQPRNRGGKHGDQSPDKLTRWDTYKLNDLFSCMDLSGGAAAPHRHPHPGTRSGPPRADSLCTPEGNASKGSTAAYSSGSRTLVGSGAKVMQPSTSSGARRQSGPGPIVRSASEIRRAYGRPAPARSGVAGASSRIGDVSGVMSENVARMHERGEKLENIELKAQNLEKDAESFAAMAKKLNESQQKSWFNF